MGKLPDGAGIEAGRACRGLLLLSRQKVVLAPELEWQPWSWGGDVRFGI